MAVFLATGYFFGNIPFVQKNFELVIVAILVISVMPMLYEVIRSRREKKHPTEPAAPNAE